MFTSGFLSYFWFMFVFVCAHLLFLHLTKKNTPNSRCYINICLILLHFYYHYVLFSYLQILQVLCARTYHHHGTHIGTTRSFQKQINSNHTLIAHNFMTSARTWERHTITITNLIFFFFLTLSFLPLLKSEFRRMMCQNKT